VFICNGKLSVKSLNAKAEAKLKSSLLTQTIAYQSLLANVHSKIVRQTTGPISCYTAVVHQKIGFHYDNLVCILEGYLRRQTSAKICIPLRPVWGQR